jgi:hypothetical protein
MITPISTSPAPVHRSRETPPRQDGAFGCAVSVGEGEAVAVSSPEADGLEVGVTEADSSVASVGAEVAVPAGSVVVVAVGVSVEALAGSVEVTPVVAAGVVRVSVAVDVGRVASGVAVEDGSVVSVVVGGGCVDAGCVDAGCVDGGRVDGGRVGGGCVGGGGGAFVGCVGSGVSVSCGTGVRVGTVSRRKGLCPDAAHSSGPAAMPMIAVTTSASSRIHIVRFMILAPSPLYHNRRGRPGQVCCLLVGDLHDNVGFEPQTEGQRIPVDCLWRRCGCHQVRIRRQDDRQRDWHRVGPGLLLNQQRVAVLSAFRLDDLWQIVLEARCQGLSVLNDKELRKDSFARLARRGGQTVGRFATNEILPRRRKRCRRTKHAAGWYVYAEIIIVAAVYQRLVGYVHCIPR